MVQARTPSLPREAVRRGFRWLYDCVTILYEPKAGIDGFIISAGRSHYHVGMSIDVFGYRVHHDIGTKIEGILVFMSGKPGELTRNRRYKTSYLKVRRHERVVYH